MMIIITQVLDVKMVKIQNFIYGLSFQHLINFKQYDKNKISSSKFCKILRSGYQLFKRKNSSSLLLNIHGIFRFQFVQHNIIISTFFTFQHYFNIQRNNCIIYIKKIIIKLNYKCAK
jgi:hypothetical protein